MQFRLIVALLAAALYGQEKAVIEGVVVHAGTGQPLRKAEVVLQQATAQTQAAMRQLAPPTATATTGADGKFSLTAEPGTYYLQGRRQGFINSNYGARKPGRRGVPIEVHAGEKMTDMRLSLTPQGVISGRVLDEEGEPFQQAYVEALFPHYRNGKREYSAAGGDSTNDLGEYRIAFLTPGKYILRVSPQPRAWLNAPSSADKQAYSEMYFPSTREPSQAAPVELNAGAVVNGIDVRVEKHSVYSIRGTIRHGETGDMVPNVNLVIVPAGSGGFQRGMRFTRNPDGTFEINGIHPGSWLLIANHTDQKQKMQARMELNVGEGDVDNVDLRLLPGRPIDGVIHVAEGDAPSLANVRVFLQSLDDMPVGAAAQAEASGAFHVLDVVPGEYRLTMQNIPAGMYVAAMKMGDQDVMGRRLVVGQSQPAPLAITLGTKGGSVAGTAALGNDMLPGVTVVLLPEDVSLRESMFTRTATTDQRGYFQITAVAPGNYIAIALDGMEMGAWEDPEFVRTLEPGAAKVKVEPGGSQTVSLKVVQ